MKRLSFQMSMKSRIRIEENSMSKAKVKTAFFCQECGVETAKWAGQCPSCKAWNTIVEEVISSAKPQNEEIQAKNWKNLKSGIHAELHRKDL